VSEQNDKLPGYYNHCSLCGHIAAAHYPQVDGKGSGYTMEEHDFVPSPYEMGTMGSPVPTWLDYWALHGRIEQLEQQVAKLAKGGV